MIPVSDVDVVRRVFAALDAGDLNALEPLFSPDAVWHEPGDNVHSGTCVGWPEIRDDFLALLGPLSQDSFRTELVDIAVVEGYVVALHRARGRHHSRTLDSVSCLMTRLVRGQIHEVWSSHFDQGEVDAFWT